MKKIFVLTILALACAFGFGQSVTLTFTGRDANNHFIPLNRVMIGDQTRGWQETIYYPDTTLTMQNGTGISEYAADGGFSLSQNNPNPFNGVTDVNLTVAETGSVAMEVTDVIGRLIAAQNTAITAPGTHQFRVNVANAGIYFLTARQNGKTSSVKMVNNGNGTSNGIEYAGSALVLKTGTKGNTSNPFSFGDEMIYIGYATVNGTEYTSQTIHQNQLVSESFTLNFNATYEEPTGLATVTTGQVTDITWCSATCGGTVTSDGGLPFTSRGVCWSTSQNPTVSDSHSTDGSGTGSFTSSVTGLSELTTYYVRSYATNEVGTAYGDQQTFSTGANPDGQPCPGAATLTDVDGNTYNTVQIGSQCWMKENLKTTKYADGTPIENGSATSYDVAYWYYPNNVEANKATYGLLYNWKAVMRNATSSEANPSGVQGICPTGWHVPSDAEWTQLTDYVSSQSGYWCNGSSYNIAKALASTTGWYSYTGSNSDKACYPGYNSSGNNATGFSALPAGTYGGIYHYFHNDAYFWSATEDCSSSAYGRNLHYNIADVNISYHNKAISYSVRCVRD